ncbi:MAG: TonB-dependent receptor [Acidobacteria bacterium]|nr:TonB-dependent receptor [Acidobacteriota bacterium]
MLFRSLLVRAGFAAWLALEFTASVWAAEAAFVHGTVTDPLGAAVHGAKVELIEGQRVTASTTTGPEGDYRLSISPGRRYRLRVTAPSFAPAEMEVPFARAREIEVNAILSIQPLASRITVTATGTPTPEAQIGASVSTLGPGEYPYVEDVQQALRLIPGLQLTQTGERGGAASLFIRGGNGNDNKVLVDGIPVGDIGGDVDFSSLALAGIDNVEVLRAPNSALYGSDALAGVVNLSTARGSTPLPALTYRAGGGNFGTYEQEATIGGVYRQFDYFGDFARFDTSNSIPGSRFHNATGAANFGWTLSATTRLQATARRLVSAGGNPNALDLFGIADSAEQKTQSTLMGATLENQTTRNWHNLVRLSAQRLDGEFTDFAPTGIPYASPVVGGVYIGAPVTIRGANGYTASGQALFQFPGVYPNQFLNSAARDIVYGESDYRFGAHMTGLGSFKYEHERGDTSSTGAARSAVDRTNYGGTIEAKGDLGNRVFFTVGTGIDDNAVFGREATPRATIAYHLARPASAGSLSGTKLRFTFSSGVKEPAISQQTESLFGLLEPLPNGPELISKYQVKPIAAERSRTFDGGLDQQLFGGRGVIGITYFRNRFTDGIEFVPQTGLVSLGIPPAVAQATLFGAFINSQRLRAQGAEIEVNYKLAANITARAGYTYLDAVVESSFSSDALFPSINPRFPTIPIGAFSPLRGARPFRRAPHSGYFGIYYAHSRWMIAAMGTLVGRRDDSNFLSDKDGGTTLLLPNRNLDPSYQLIDLSASYRVRRSFALYTSFENLLDQRYQEAIGYPALPFSLRSGVKITLGGESWKLN